MTRLDKNSYWKETVCIKTTGTYLHKTLLFTAIESGFNRFLITQTEELYMYGKVIIDLNKILTHATVIVV